MVVIIDVFRATSTIASALHNGAQCIIPVDEVAKAIALSKNINGSIAAGAHRARGWIPPQAFPGTWPRPVS